MCVRVCVVYGGSVTYISGEGYEEDEEDEAEEEALKKKNLISTWRTQTVSLLLVRLKTVTFTYLLIYF